MRVWGTENSCVVCEKDRKPYHARHWNVVHAHNSNAQYLFQFRRLCRLCGYKHSILFFFALQERLVTLSGVMLALGR